MLGSIVVVHVMSLNYGTSVTTVTLCSSAIKLMKIYFELMKLIYFKNFFYKNIFDNIEKKKSNSDPHFRNYVNISKKLDVIHLLFLVRTAYKKSRVRSNENFKESYRRKKKFHICTK
jgi:hypothetical protein